MVVEEDARQRPSTVEVMRDKLAGRVASVAVNQLDVLRPERG